jgi:hypothetical protein
LWTRVLVAAPERDELFFSPKVARRYPRVSKSPRR